jgi:hypothetical protein
MPPLRITGLYMLRRRFLGLLFLLRKVSNFLPEFDGDYANSSLI